MQALRRQTENSLERAGKMGIEPYVWVEVTTQERRYNPEYGDDRLCECGHPYHRHFDSYDEMADVGCKYCHCTTFVEETDQLQNVK